MFTLEGKLTFINIDQSYLKKLHDASWILGLT